MTLEERIAKINSKYNFQTPTVQNQNQNNISFKEGITRAAGQGLSFGFGDELEALYNSKKNKTSYEEELTKVRGKLKQFREDSPVAAYGTEIGASIPSMVAGGAGIVRQFKRELGEQPIKRTATRKFNRKGISVL